MNKNSAKGKDMRPILFNRTQDNILFSKVWRQAANQLDPWIKSLIIFFGIIALLTVILMYDNYISGLSTETFDPIFIEAPFFIFIFIMIIFGSIYTEAEKIRLYMRASAFAEANDFTISSQQEVSKLGGAIFSVGEDRHLDFVVQGQHFGQQFKIFNYHYTTGSGRNKNEQNLGVIMLELPRKVPHVIFDSRSDNFLGLSSYDVTFNKSQKFTFEGDFNNHFDVYAPEKYGRDVLYFMTPELMALLIDKANNYDVEVVDNSLFFYADVFDYKTAELAQIFELIEVLGTEFSENVRRYADERVGNKMVDEISEPGRRLKKGISWITIGFIVIYILIIFIRD